MLSFSPRKLQKNIFSIFVEKLRLIATSSRKKPMGFTLIEIMIVIAIIATLSGIAVPLYSKYLDTAMVTHAIAEIKLIGDEILSFSIDNDRFPTDLSEIGLGNTLDPYGNPYQYQPSTYIDKNGKVKVSNQRRKDHNLVPVNTDFDLFSMGRDGESVAPFTAKASLDDIVRANNGLFIGLVSDY